MARRGALLLRPLLLAVPGVWAARVVHVHQAERLQSEASNPPLCAAEIVATTCTLLSGGVADVSAQELRKVLAAEESAVTNVWAELGLPEGQRASCLELCAATTGLIGQHWQLPPLSDVACYFDGSETKCDLDLSPATLSNLVPKGQELPDLHDQVPLPAEEEAKGRQADGPRVFKRSTTVDYALHDILVRIANLFRIYPTPATSFVREGTPAEGSLLEELDEELGNGTRAICDLTCKLLPNPCKRTYACGACPECQGGSGGGNPTKYATTSSIPRKPTNYPTTSSTSRKPTNYPTTSSTSRKPTNYPTTSSTSRKPTNYPTTSSTSRKPTNYPTTSSTSRKPTVPVINMAGRRRPTTSKPVTADPTTTWKTEVQKRNVQAQAYVNKAIMKLQSRQAKRSTVKWFGRDAHADQHIQAEMLRVLNAVANMMGNVEYVYPGPECSPNTYAYVYPRGSLAKDRNGKFVFYLCRLYMKSEVSVQIETLTHEGSHHATAYTDDVCMDEFYGNKRKPNYVEEPLSSFPGSVNVGHMLDYRIGGARTTPAVVQLIKGSTVVLQLNPEEDCENKAYGRQPCADLARKDAVKALRNADNVCYWIQDVAEEG